MSAGSYQLHRRPINLDIFTDAYRVSGQAEVGSGGIFSELDNQNSDFLEVLNAYVSRINEPGKIAFSYERAAFRKDSINFVVLADRRDGVAVGSQHGRSIFTRGRPVEVFIALPDFEVTGTVMFDGKATPSTIIVQSFGGYISVFDSTASAALYPDLQYSGDLILVQKKRISILSLADQRL
jgi:hypothetical protein